MRDTQKNWFTEECAECGTAFSLEIDKKIHEEQTRFQKIEIYATKTFGNLMVIDGFIMLTERDNFIYHEMMAHPVLFTHPMPKDIVIVGGGDCGTLREVIKHECARNIFQIEIDERVTQISEKFFPDLCSANNDPRVEFIYEDAIKWMRQTRSDSVDIIIIDSTDPIGPAKGLFSTSFYSDCFRALKPDGLLVQQSESPLVHMQSIIQPMHACMQQAGFKETQLMHFPQPTYPIGWWSATLASSLKQEIIAREDEAIKLDFSTQYYNHSIHMACLATPQFLVSS